MPLSLGIASGAGFLKNPAEPAALGYRVNYITNPSFEVDIAGWSSVAGATLSRTTGEFNTGSASLSVTNSSGSAAQFGIIDGTMIPLVAGEGTYYISAYVKLASGNASANYFLRVLQYEEQTSSSTVAAANIGTTNLSYTGNWVRLSGSFTKNSGANFAIIRVVTGSTVSGEIFYVDSVMLEKSTTLKSYFDGSSGGFWSGSANASFSGATPY
jgi:hypothetical protein